MLAYRCLVATDCKHKKSTFPYQCIRRQMSFCGLVFAAWAWDLQSELYELGVLDDPILERGQSEEAIFGMLVSHCAPFQALVRLPALDCSNQFCRREKVPC